MGVLNNQVNILFTSVGRRVELINAWRQAYLNLKIDGQIIGTDIDPLAASFTAVDKGYIVPKTTMDSFIPSIIKICEKEKIDLVFPLIDPDIPVLSEKREHIEKTGAKVIVSPINSVNIANDKLKTNKYFRDISIPTPHVYDLEDVNTRDFPLFVKPRCGSAAIGSHKVNCREELLFYIKEIESPIIQEYLPGPEITNDIACDFDGNLLGVVSRQRIEVRNGEVAKGKTIFNQDIINGCRKIVENLHFCGPITIQCMMNDNTPYFTEINARFGGGVPLSIFAGMNSPLWYLTKMAGLNVYIPKIGTYKIGIYLTRYDKSLFLNEDELEKIRSNIL